MEQIKKSRILMLTFVYSPNIGGVETHLDDLTRYLLRRGHRITVLTYKTLGLNEKCPITEKKEDLTILRIPWFHPAIFNSLETMPILQILYLVPPIFLYTVLYLLTKRRHFDVIQVHGFNMAIVGAIVSYIYRIPFVVNTHVSFYFQQSSVYAKVLGFFLKRAKSILVLTKEAKQELIKIGIDKRKIDIYHYWVNSTNFYPRDKIICRKKLGISEDKFIVLFVGRFSPAKGISILLEASTDFSNQVQTLFCGTGPLAQNIEEKSKALKTIKLIGSVSQQDLPFYYSASDIVIIPSTPATKTYSEGIPRVLIESYSCGVPVMATPAGGTANSITKQTGFFIHPDAKSIATQIKILITKQHQLKKMGKSCISFAENNYSEKINGPIIEKTLL